MRNLEVVGDSVFLRKKLNYKCKGCFFYGNSGCFAIECDAEDDLDDEYLEGRVNYKVLIRCS